MRANNIVNGIDVSAHAGLVARQARRYRAFIGGSIEWEDLCQAGWFGVIRAAEKFDHARGLKFSTYAAWWIRNYIQRCVVDERRTVRVPSNAQRDAHARGEMVPLGSLSLDAPRAGDDVNWIDALPSDSDTEAEAERNELAAIVRGAVESLAERDRIVIDGRNWRDETLLEVGDRMGVCRERVRQRERTALRKLRTKLAIRGADV